jgi:probable addiction module antidote protein
MTEEIADMDVAGLLRSDAAIEDFMTDALESGDAGYIAHAIGIVARAKGMTRIAGETGLAREALYRSFSEDGNPSLKSTIAVLKSLGFELTARPLSSSTATEEQPSQASA